jgi:hypothetical protein
LVLPDQRESPLSMALRYREKLDKTNPTKLS